MTTTPKYKYNISKIHSLNLFSRVIFIKKEKLLKIAENADLRYHPFESKDVKLGKVIKKRNIDNPGRSIKNIQSQINNNILKKVSLPAYIIGGVKGRIADEHPAMHSKKTVVVTVDIKKFFPNITDKMVYDVWVNRLGFSPKMASLATRLTTYKHYLPQGAPSSTILANLVLLPAIEEIATLAKQNGFGKVSQQVDDLAISGKRLPPDFVTRVIKIFNNFGFSVSHKKVKVQWSGSKQEVTKRVVNRKNTFTKEWLKALSLDVRSLKDTPRSHPAFEKIRRSVLGKIVCLKKLQPNIALRHMRVLEKHNVL